MCLFFFAKKKKKDVCSLKTKAGLHSVHSLSLSLFFAVDFVDCGRGSGLRFESGDPADFRIEADGTVFAARTLQLSDRKGRSLEIKAKDVKSQEQWLVHVNFTQPKQVGSQARSHVNRERRLRDCENHTNYNCVRSLTAHGVSKLASRCNYTIKQPLCECELTKMSLFIRGPL